MKKDYKNVDLGAVGHSHQFIWNLYYGIPTWRRFCLSESRQVWIPHSLEYGHTPAGSSDLQLLVMESHWHSRSPLNAI